MCFVAACARTSISQTIQSTEHCQYGICASSDVADCCNTDGDRMQNVSHPQDKELGSRLRGATRKLEEDAEAEPNGTTIVLCACQSDEPRQYRSVASSMVVVSIMAMVALVSSMIFIFTKSIRQRHEIEHVEPNGVSTSGHQLIELVYKSKIEESKASLVTAKAEHADDRCAICLDVLKDDLARPQACGHVFHRTCIESWIDHVTPPALQRDLSHDELHHPEHTNRKLMCPICGRPFINRTDDRTRSTLNWDLPNHHNQIRPSPPVTPA